MTKHHIKVLSEVHHCQTMNSNFGYYSVSLAIQTHKLLLFSTTAGYKNGHLTTAVVIKCF